MELQHRTATAWLAYAEGDEETALETMRAAAEQEAATEKHPVTPGAVLPARERLGDLLRDLVYEQNERCRLSRLTIDLDGTVLRTGARVDGAARGFSPHPRPPARSCVFSRATRATDRPEVDA